MLPLPAPPPPKTEVFPAAVVLLSELAPKIGALLLLPLVPNTAVVADLFSPLDPNVGVSVLLEFEPNIDVELDKLLLVLLNIGATPPVVDGGFKLGDPKLKTLVSGCFSAVDLFATSDDEL